METIDVAAQESNKKKNALSVLALKTGAHLSWNLETYEQKYGTSIDNTGILYFRKNDNIHMKFTMISFFVMTWG